MEKQTKGVLSVSQCGVRIESNLVVPTCDGIVISTSTSGDGVRMYGYMMPRPMELEKNNIFTTNDNKQTLFLKPNVALHMPAHVAVDSLFMLGKQLIENGYISKHTSIAKKKEIVSVIKTMLHTLEKEIEKQE